MRDDLMDWASSQRSTPRALATPATTYIQTAERCTKSFTSHKAHAVTLIFVSSAFSHTPAYSARPMIWGCFARCACLRPSFRLC